MELDLIYAGSKQPESNLNFVAYEDQYFEQYAQGLRTSFYELRMKNDFQPFFAVNWMKKKEKNFWTIKTICICFLKMNILFHR